MVCLRFLPWCFVVIIIQSWIVQRFTMRRQRGIFGLGCLDHTRLLRIFGTQRQICAKLWMPLALTLRIRWYHHAGRIEWLFVELHTLSTSVWADRPIGRISNHHFKTCCQAGQEPQIQKERHRKGQPLPTKHKTSSALHPECKRGSLDVKTSSLIFMMVTMLLASKWETKMIRTGWWDSYWYYYNRNAAKAWDNNLE